MKLLSIIIPCFNSENHIEKAINSIFQASENEKYYEIIAVDDGSTDKTLKILEKMAFKNKNIKVFSKKNGNWGSVVNYIKHNKLASGKYVTILDSDDWYQKGSLNKIKKALNRNYDLIVTNFYVLRKRLKNAHIGFFRRSKEINKYEILTSWSMPLGKFIKKEIFYKLDDLKENTFFQDMIFYNNIISISNKVFYNREKIGTWNQQNEKNSSNLEWKKEKVQVFVENLDYIKSTFNNKFHNGYCLYYYYFLRKYLSKYNFKIVLDPKNTELSWIGFGIRNPSKKILFFILRKLIINK